MKTLKTHISNFGSARPTARTSNGYIVYHDSNRYAKATSSQLNEWAESRIEIVRNAANIELSERAMRRATSR